MYRYLFNFFLLLSLPFFCLSQSVQQPAPVFKADHALSRYEMDSLYAPVFNHQVERTSRPGPGFPRTSKKPTKATRITSLGEFLQRTNSICYDTSSRFFLDSDSLMYYVQDPVRTRDGNLLISGEYINYTDYRGGGFLMKCDNDGNLLWNRLYDSANAAGFNYFNFFHPVELMDGSILLAGFTNNPVTENDDVVMIRTDANGALIWNKMFYSRFWTHGNGSADYFYLQDVKQDPYTGDIYFGGTHWGNGKALVKMELATGTILWGNSYSWASMGYASFDWPFGMDIRQDEIRYWGRNLGNLNTFISVTRINKQTGDTISRRLFKCTDTNSYRVEFLVPDRLTILNNGNTVLSGRVYGNWMYLWDGVYPLFHASQVEIDDNLNVVRGTVYRSPVEDNGYNTRVTVFPDGSATLNFLRVYSGYTADAYFSHLREGQIIKRRVKQYTNSGFPWENRTLRLPDGGDITVKLLGDSVNNNGRIEFLKRHASDTASYCLGYDDTLTFAQPIHYIPLQMGFDTVYRDVFLEHTPKTVRLTTYSGYRSPACFQVSHCDTVWLTASPTVACPGMPVTIQVHKNNDCGTEVPLQYDTTGVSSVVRNNDSTYTFIFNSSWNNFVRASLMGCAIHLDSVHLTILAAPPAVNLGPDTVICPSNTLLLHAGPGFYTYEWQDGSTDSLFNVTQPGQYYVNVTNACGGTFTDTINVVPHPPIPFSIGPDRTKCNSDTIQLNAPSGFLNYAWSPAYTISSTTAQNVIVNPVMDTAYMIKAEKTPGCFAFDTVRITVHTSSPINLGADKGICAGDSLLLDAGPGFSSYYWSNGALTQWLSIKTAGQYSVTGSTAQGCVSKDTFRLISVYALPVITLNPDTTLCTGSSRLLDAGPGYSVYNWNTGSHAATITVNGTGLYAVTVTDNNGCKGTGTTVISKILLLPAGFLFADTAICSFGNIRLEAALSFNAYHWNTGSTAASISIDRPGVYWLDATDQRSCTGRDSVIVIPRECLKGLYVPSGFTPNGDGKNELLRPYLFGNVKKYEFRVFNRWGETVFVTRDLNAGWNGRYKGLLMDGDVFAWSCRYQLEGEEEKMGKGTVVLIR